MEVRSYYASTIEAAIEAARQELGSDALLIQSQRASAEWAHLGRYEVVFAGELQPERRETLRAARHTREISETVASRTNSHAGSDFRSILAEAASKGMGPGSRGCRESEPRIDCRPGLGLPNSKIKAVALVGPPGSGKTTVAMRLALEQGIESAKRTRLAACVDTRPGSTLVLERFCTIFDIDFADCESSREVELAVLNSEKPVTIIDATPSCLTPQLCSLAEIEVQLVLRIDRKTSSNLAAIEQFSHFKPARLVLTALDETSELSDIPELVRRAGLPVSYLSMGERLTETLIPARPDRLAQIITRGSTESACFAA